MPNKYHRLLFSIAFILTLYVILIAPLLGLITYLVLYWAWLTFLSFISIRFPNRSAVSKQTARLARIFSVFGIVTILGICGVLVFPQVWMGIIFSILVHLTYFSFPLLFLICCAVLFVDLQNRIKVSKLENCKINKYLSLLIMPIGFWSIQLKSKERKNTINTAP